MRAIGDKQFDGFLATSKSRLMQSSPSILILRIHPHQQIARVSTSMLPELAAPQIQIFHKYSVLEPWPLAVIRGRRHYIDCFKDVLTFAATSSATRSWPKVWVITDD
jgi:hypothetical protein|tara:strand:- start:3483 stop:3803 length:321 start_codon:yes stop_codon:yes gene_type:complete